MLKKIRIRNFQAYEDKTFHFDPGVTTILGKSDVGKTAILRALRWVCLNKPRGDGFVRHGASFVKVTIWIDNHIISRKKSKKENIYILDGVILKNDSSTNSIPEEIQAILNVGEENFQKQMDPPFWFSLSAGQVSKELNKIINLNLIDSSLQRSKSKVKKAKDRLIYCEDDLQTIRTKLKELNWVPELMKDVNRITLLQEARAKGEVKVKELESILEYAVEARDFISDSLETQKALQPILKLGAKYLEQESKIKELSYLINEMFECNSHCTVKLPDISLLEAKYKKIQEEGVKLRPLNKLISSIKAKEEYVCHLNESLGKTEETLHKMTKGKCPICGNRIKVLREES